MERVLNSVLREHLGKEVIIKGWLHSFRLLGNLSFLIVRDRSGLAQVVLTEKEQIKEIKDLQIGSVLQIKGTVKKSEQVEAGAELIDPVVTLVSAISEAWPVEINKAEINANIDTILDFRPLTLRHLKNQAIFKIQGTLVAAYREYLSSQGFTEFFGPNVIGASSEGGSELFKVDYFGESAMLSQSAQLYKQMMVGVYERVFALMKCFRAEKSNTRRHLTEATQFEFEMGFIDGFEDVMEMLENTLRFMLKAVESKNASELELLGVELPKVSAVGTAFPRIKFRDALELFYKRTGVDERHEIDLSPAAEKEMCKWAREEYGSDFVFVTNFLRVKTAFYAHPNEHDPEVCDYFDLLCREIEIVSGGQRIHDHDQLVDSLKLKGLNPDSFTDYLSIFKFGMPPHGGFGMGMERLTMMMLGLENIREATMFPSDPRRIASVRLQPKSYVGSNLRNEIIARLKKAGVDFKAIEHEPTPTSEDSARVRGTKMQECVKAIILRNKKTGDNLMVCVPSNQRVDIKAIDAAEGGKFEFEKPEVIKQKFGLEVGSIPPFGNLMGLKTYFAKSVADEKRAAFNCGSLTESVTMYSKDLIELIQPVLI